MSVKSSGVASGPAGQSAKPAVRPPLSWRKKLLFGAGTLAVVLIALEGLLALAGVRPVLYDEDPYVGFSSQVPLFEERKTADGVVLETAPHKLLYFRPQTFSKQKAGGTYRAFTVGGSTTYGQPFAEEVSFTGWLRTYLPVADSSRKWEVINCGGISYASYRAALIVEEIAQYQPDLVIIYSGQNEFLERRTYGDLLDIPAPVRSVGGLAGRTRLYAVARRAMNFSTPPAPPATRAELDEHVVTLLDHSVGPTEYTRDDTLRDQVVGHFRYNLARMIDIARSAGAEVVVVTPATNLRDCSPFKSEPRAGLREDQARRFGELIIKAQEARKAQKWKDALEAVEAALAIDNRYAEAHYVRGQILESLGRHADAKIAYQRALDEDICPLRALTPIRQAVTEVAKERGARLVDFAAWVEEQSPHGIPGKDLLVDHVHPTIEAHRRLALSIFDELRQQGVVRPSADWTEATIDRVRKDVEGRQDQQAQGIAMRNLAKVLKWGGKFAEGKQAALKAIEWAPTDAEAHFIAGSCAKSLGEIGEAMRHYQFAIKWNPDFALAHSNLAALYEERGRRQDAIRRYREAAALARGADQVQALTALGRLLIEAGSVDEALRYLNDALRQSPNFVEARIQMGVGLFKQARHDAALVHLEKAVELEPQSAPALTNRGIVLQSLGRQAEALDSLRAATRVAPHDARMHYNLAFAHDRIGRKDDALAGYRVAWRLDPDFAAAATGQTHILLAKRRFTDIETILGQPLRPATLQAAQDFAWALATRPDEKFRDGARAVKWAEQVVATKGGRTIEAYDVLAAAYAEAGRFDDAVATITTAIQSAEQTQQPKLAQSLQKRLALYRQKRPYRTAG
jgi:tetratricopeptide (TPR) repeat protein